MNFVGIDIHKKYSVLTAKNRKGQTLGTFRVSGNSRFGFSEVFKGLGGKSTVVIEACWNWGKIYDTLENLAEVREVVVAHPSKTRLIADAQIKTDKVDSAALADLLRGSLIPRVHVPPPAARARKDRLRQRLYWARLRTKIRNRVHALLDRQDDLQLPQCSDIFGVRGMGYLRKLALPEPDNSLLGEDLTLLDLLREQIKAQEKQIQHENQADEATRLVESIPGMGKILAAVVACEIDDIQRFPSVEKLCAFAGLVPTTHASGGKVYNGNLLPYCNKHLRWAFIEASWVSIGCSPYFATFYRQQRQRGKKANTAITIVARRMCRITWQLLRQKRNFHETKPKERRRRVKTISPVAPNCC
jgi:transposase